MFGRVVLVGYRSYPTEIITVLGFGIRQTFCFIKNDNPRNLLLHWETFGRVKQSPTGLFTISEFQNHEIGEF